MTRMKFAATSLIVGFAALASIAVAQQERAEERGGVIKGKVIVLRDAAASGKEVNKGGLVVADIPHSASHQPKFHVEAKGFQELGRVQGDRLEAGQQLLGGGGYTWVLLKPVNEGPTQITVRYTPNPGGQEVTLEYDLTVTAE